MALHSMALFDLAWWRHSIWWVTGRGLWSMASEAI